MFVVVVFEAVTCQGRWLAGGVAGMLYGDAGADSFESSQLIPLGCCSDSLFVVAKASALVSARAPSVSNLLFVHDPIDSP